MSIKDCRDPDVLHAHIEALNVLIDSLQAELHDEVCPGLGDIACTETGLSVDYYVRIHPA